MSGIGFIPGLKQPARARNLPGDGQIIAKSIWRQVRVKFLGIAFRQCRKNAFRRIEMAQASIDNGLPRLPVRWRIIDPVIRQPVPRQVDMDGSAILVIAATILTGSVQLEPAR